MVGAGIGGLTVAHALRQSDWSVRVIERAPEHQPVGAGLFLGPNAVAVLDLLGIDVRPVALATPEILVKDRGGKVLQKMHWDAHDALALARSDLHDVLSEGIEVEFSTPFDAESHTADLVIGADGVHSAVRKHLGMDMPLRYSGYTCWRALVDNPGVPEACEYWGSGTRVGLVPLTQNRLYVFLVRNAAQGAPGPQTAREVAALFGGYADPVPPVLKEVAAAEVLHHDLSDLPGRVWGDGDTWLLGDAAHAMLPNQGQGAGMAIEDSLAVIMAANDGGLNRYAALRDARVAEVQRDSYRIGRFAQVENPVAVHLRNGLARVAPDKLRDRAIRRLMEPGTELVDAARPLFG